MPQDIFSSPLYGRRFCLMIFSLPPSLGDGYASRHFLSTPLRDGYASWHFLSTLLREPSAFSRRAVVRYWRKYMHEVLVNRLGGLSLPRKSVVSLTDRRDMTLGVYRGHNTTIQQQQLFGRRLCLMTFSLHPSTGDGHASWHLLSTPLREMAMPHDIFCPPRTGRRSWLMTYFLSNPLREMAMPHDIFSQPLSGRLLCLMTFSLHPSTKEAMPYDIFSPPLYGRRLCLMTFFSAPLREMAMSHDLFSPSLYGR